ncbi:hypothetical protein JCM5353_004775 [Sporobolomyces roseus]
MNGAELGDLGLASVQGEEVRAAARREPDDARDTAEQQDVRDSLEGDIGRYSISDDEDADDSLADISPIEAALAARPPRPDHIDLPLPLLELPAPALDIPSSDLYRRRSKATRRDSIAVSFSTAASPRLRTHFDLTSSPNPHLAPPPPLPFPLKPILQHTTSHQAAPREADIADSIRREFSRTSSYHSEDEALPGVRLPHQREKRKPHPLYTPAPKHRRRRRKKSESVASGRTGRSSRSARSKVKHALRKVRRRRRRGSHSSATSSSSSSSSSSSTSTTSGSSKSSTVGSTRSSSTWAGWRFWRNSSSGSSSSDDDSSSDDEWDPPTPHFTLLTPHLARPALAYPSHLFSGSTHPSRRNSFNMPRGGGGIPSNAQTPLESSQPPSNVPVFDLLNATTLAPTLERLQAFWLERRQEDGIGGDLGVGTGGGGADTPEEGSYFPPPPDVAAAAFAESGNSASTPATPAFTPGVAGGPSTIRRLRGEIRAARAEEKRFGKNRAMENGPAWWLDIMCPTVADMRELRKFLPLHPLTIEDILHQETREKLESFPALGYYFIAYRALDESYFKYTSPDPSPTSSMTGEHEKDDSRNERKPGESSGKRGRVDIVEGVGGKEGVEGVGVGAINLYLVVFGDGILSFHFEPVDQHIERVQGKLQEFGVARNFSSRQSNFSPTFPSQLAHIVALEIDWIAYSLMDSIVDSFFPLINFIEGESNEISAFLSDPLTHLPSGRFGYKKKTKPLVTAFEPSLSDNAEQHYNDEIIGISVEPPSENLEKELDIDLSTSRFSAIKVSTRLRRRMTGGSSTSSFSRFIPTIRLPAAFLRILPERLAIRARTDRIIEKTMLADDQGIEMYPLGGAETGIDMSRLTEQHNHKRPRSDVSKRDKRFDNRVMLNRITDMRKLVTGLSRLLGPKRDVVRGLRKRTMADNLGMFKNDSKHDISVYIGDLFDHTLAMYQSISYYDAVLSHDHPTYQGMLRMHLNSTKLILTKNIVRLTIVTVTFLPLASVTGLFSENIRVPHNGDREEHLRADGTHAPHNWFGIVICITFTVMCSIWTLIWFIFRSTRRKFKKRGHIIS